MTLQQIKSYLRNGPYAWPGGYPLYFVTSDGAALSFTAVKAEWREIVAAHLAVKACPSSRRNNAQWLIEGADINWEDTKLYCDHTGELIESAYGNSGIES